MRRFIVAVLGLAVIFPAACGDGDDPLEQFTIGFLRAVEGAGQESLIAELRAAGYIVGDNLTLLPEDDAEIHPDPEDAEATVREWIEQGADIVFAFSSTGAAAAREATDTVPVIFLVNDPTVVGLVENEERPEANLTGATFRVPADRTLDLAGQAIPGLTNVGLIVPSDDPAATPYSRAIEEAAETLGLEVTTEAFTTPEDVPRAFDVLVGAGVQAVVVANAPTAIRALGAIEPAAAAHNLPLIASTDFATGATVVLTPDTTELLAQMGRMAVRLLQGAEPGDIPVEDPRQFRVVLNAKRAGELGLPPFPDGLLRQADEVIR